MRRDVFVETILLDRNSDRRQEAGGRSMFDKRLFNSYKKRIDPFLAPGEELLSATPVEASGVMKGYFYTGGELGVAIKGAMRDRKAREAETSGGDEGAVKLASANMTLATTSRRLLIFKFGTGKGANPKWLLTDVPIGDVDSIEVGPSTGISPKPVTLIVRGQSFELEARKAINTDKLTSTFQQAKAAQVTR
jgi:hypothetical protein